MSRRFPWLHSIHLWSDARSSFIAAYSWVSMVLLRALSSSSSSSSRVEWATAMSLLVVLVSLCLRCLLAPCVLCMRALESSDAPPKATSGLLHPPFPPTSTLPPRSADDLLIVFSLPLRLSLKIRRKRRGAKLLSPSLSLTLQNLCIDVVDVVVVVCLLSKATAAAKLPTFQHLSSRPVNSRESVMMMRIDYGEFPMEIKLFPFPFFPLLTTGGRRRRRKQSIIFLPRLVWYPCHLRSTRLDRLLSKAVGESRERETMTDYFVHLQIDFEENSPMTVLDLYEPSVVLRGDPADDNGMLPANRFHRSEATHTNFFSFFFYSERKRERGGLLCIEWLASVTRINDTTHKPVPTLILWDIHVFFKIEKSFVDIYFGPSSSSFSSSSPCFFNLVFFPRPSRRRRTYRFLVHQLTGNGINKNFRRSGRRRRERETI